MKLNHFCIWAVLVLFGFTEARAFYNPTTGRWLNRDPIGERGGPNPNVFCSNAAISKQDADGRLMTDEWICNKGEHGMPQATPGEFLLPASALSVANWLGSVPMVFNETDWFIENPVAQPATQRAQNYFMKALANSAKELCANKCPSVKSFYGGSGPVTPTLIELETSGALIREWPIPQDFFWSEYVLRGVEYRLTRLVAKRKSDAYIQWDIEISIIDKLGWEAAAYGPNYLATAVAGPSREFVRGRFNMNGIVRCDEKCSQSPVR